MTRLRRIGVLGGTFDPIHGGHLAAGLAARSALDLDEVRVVPAHDPQHRAAQPCASSFHRFAMAALAISGEAELAMSDIELAVIGPSYTATTLRRLHGHGFDPSELFFVTGSDAFAEIASWREYPAVLDLCHFIVISRPGWGLEALRTRLPDLARRMRTIGRDGMAGLDGEVGGGVSIFLVEHRTPDVSSTDIRGRVRDGRPITGLVPPPVEQYIARHGLYRSADPSRAPNR